MYKQGTDLSQIRREDEENDVEINNEEMHIILRFNLLADSGSFTRWAMFIMT